MRASRTSSLNRGEGGQNIIGTELFDALGVIRTEELLQARTLDGGDQFFTRAYDFGFTKTPEEAGGEVERARSSSATWCAPSARYRPLVMPERLERHAGRRARPASARREARAAGVRRGRATRRKYPRADRRRPATLAGPQALRPARVRGRSRRRRRCGCRPGRSIRCSAAASTRSRWRAAASTSRRRWASSKRAARGPQPRSG